ncbi:uncharacterized protein METZ01_LOCUS122743 [marine metagenome]|jgi:hypothetical protein|uniref:Uncharacterized protein n=1 Tax=marine metagenome TaxID=408172 RepID=A0A381XYM8_9ZZZZ
MEMGAEKKQAPIKLFLNSYSVDLSSSGRHQDTKGTQTFLTAKSEVTYYVCLENLLKIYSKKAF